MLSIDDDDDDDYDDDDENEGENAIFGTSGSVGRQRFVGVKVGVLDVKSLNGEG